ncbi:hypothetical protein KM043_008398 [Ampulex compressa]|nr:hypothetical protein KM043_008398 [Ampulex compressa]
MAEVTRTNRKSRVKKLGHGDGRAIRPTSSTSSSSRMRFYGVDRGNLLCEGRVDQPRTAAGQEAAAPGGRGSSGRIETGATEASTSTARRRSPTAREVASIMAAPPGVASSKTRADTTPFRSWGPGACRYSAVPTCAPPPFSTAPGPPTNAAWFFLASFLEVPLNRPPRDAHPRCFRQNGTSSRKAGASCAGSLTPAWRTNSDHARDVYRFGSRGHGVGVF